MKFWWLPLLMWLPLVSAAKEKPKSSPADSAMQKLQSAWDEVKTFRCKFQQEVFAKQIGGDPDRSEGSLILRKPDHLRWESVTEGTLTVLNPKGLTLVRKALRRDKNTVDIYKKGGQSFIPRSLSFLTGKGRFAKLYRYEFIEENDTAVKLKLTPKAGGGPPGETYIAEIAKDGYLLRSLTTETVDSRVVTTFLEIEKNPKLENEPFEYQIQATDIVQRH